MCIRDSLYAVFIVFFLPVGVGIYWIAGSLIRSFQQFLLKVDAAKVMPRFLHVAVASLDNHQLAELITANAARIPLLSWLPYLPFLFARPSKAVFTTFTPVSTPSLP